MNLFTDWERKMNLNEECLLGYLANMNSSQELIVVSGITNDTLDLPEYNETAWLFV